MMEPAVKKYAEVAAFVLLAADMQHRASAGFADHAPTAAARLASIAQTDLPAAPEGYTDVFINKRDGTLAKLTSMMELYVGDEWDNPVEVLEWASFYTGAGAAHCAVAAGRLRRIGTETAIADVLSGLELSFRELLDSIITSLRI